MADDTNNQEEYPRTKQPLEVPNAIWVVVITLAALLILSLWLVILTMVNAPDDAVVPSETETEQSNETESHPLVFPYRTESKQDTSYVPEFSANIQVIPTAVINATNAALVDMSTQEVIASKKADEKIYPASMTKIMTLLVVCDHITSLDTVLEITEAQINQIKESGASVMSLSAGEKISIGSLMYGLILQSAGDAAIVLADYVAGSESAFVELMNAKATEMKLTSTHFENATGLHHDNHYTTCREMVAIFAYALDNPLPAKILTTQTYNAPSFFEKDFVYYLKAGWYFNFKDNNLSTQTSNGLTIYGGKTGFTADTYDESGALLKNHCLITCAKNADGKTYILVTAGGTGYPVNRAKDAIKLYTDYVQ